MKTILFFFIFLMLNACTISEDKGKIGSQASEILAKDLEGKSVKLSDSKEELKILVFFQNGCASCLKELPMLDEFIEKHPKKIAVYAINSVDNAEVIKVLSEQFEFKNIKVLKDELAMTSQKYGIFATPTTIIIKNNEIKDRILGEKSWEHLESKFMPLL
ncbi:TlpA family protein disulfide reductase [Campylobacter cuniculorum]|uniref:Protein disulfide reductase, TlpA family n=2 Tax=Campylobacter cuniculorum TaxID=374106 RepID=A0A1W6BVF0_9BACT|nr:TlpA disulfide reductase family protein [Campylobacter cuniculorum]ARJ56041.1 protein disulfide reductase, TlpA family [Campylobacter cuniculorum DSM 23162 = LMG 24588]QOR03542.1 TlpA family protein disulfide reductase [Campylobacter cuniculorum]